MSLHDLAWSPDLDVVVAAAGEFGFGVYTMFWGFHPLAAATWLPPPNKPYEDLGFSYAMHVVWSPADNVFLALVDYFENQAPWGIVNAVTVFVSSNGITWTEVGFGPSNTRTLQALSPVIVDLVDALVFPPPPGTFPGYLGWSSGLVTHDDGYIMATNRGFIVGFSYNGTHLTLDHIVYQYEEDLDPVTFIAMAIGTAGAVPDVRGVSTVSGQSGRVRRYGDR